MNENTRLWLSMEPADIPTSTKIDDDFWNYLKPGSNILEVGCGGGRVVFECLKRRFSVVGVDINRHGVKDLAAKNLPGVDVKCVDIMRAEFKKRFEGAFMLGFLSALAESERRQALERVWSFLQPGGYVHISEFEFSRKFKKRYDSDFKITKEYGTLSVKDSGKEVFRSHNFTKKELFGLIKSAGFNVIKFKRTEFSSYHGDKKPGMMIIIQKI